MNGNASSKSSKVADAAEGLVGKCDEWKRATLSMTNEGLTEEMKIPSGGSESSAIFQVARVDFL